MAVLYYFRVLLHTLLVQPLLLQPPCRKILLPMLNPMCSISCTDEFKMHQHKTCDKLHMHGVNSTCSQNAHMHLQLPACYYHSLSTHLSIKYNCVLLSVVCWCSEPWSPTFHARSGGLSVIMMMMRRRTTMVSKHLIWCVTVCILSIPVALTRLKSNLAWGATETGECRRRSSEQLSFCKVDVGVIALYQVQKESLPFGVGCLFKWNSKGFLEMMYNPPSYLQHVFEGRLDGSFPNIPHVPSLSPHSWCIPADQ